MQLMRCPGGGVRAGFHDLVPGAFDRGAEGVVVILGTRGTVADVSEDAVAGALLGSGTLVLVNAGSKRKTERERGTEREWADPLSGDI